MSSENKNYYPLKIVDKTNIIASIDEHGNEFWIAKIETINIKFIEEMVDAYNEKYAPKQGHAENSERSYTSIVDFTRLSDLSQKYGLSTRTLLLMIEEYEAIKEPINFARSVTDEGKLFTPSIDEQIKFLDDFLSLLKLSPMSDEVRYFAYIKENLLAIKRWNQNPLWSQLDIEKVLTDLLSSMEDAINKHGNAAPRSAPNEWINHYQNAEAALGMLQAFKEKRKKPVPYKEIPSDDPNYRKFETGAKSYSYRKFIIYNDNINEKRNEIIDNLAHALPDFNPNADDRKDTANAIVNAIDEMLKLRGL